MIEREHRCGQGYGSQNSAVMIVGLGDWEEVDEVIVRWPSGRKSIVSRVKQGEWLTVDERGGEERKPYRRDVKSKQKSLPGKAVFPLGPQSKARLTVWKGMATWCPACARYRPYFEHLKAMTRGLGVEFRGFPRSPMKPCSGQVCSGHIWKQMVLGVVEFCHGCFDYSWLSKSSLVFHCFLIGF